MGWRKFTEEELNGYDMVIIKKSDNKEELEAEISHIASNISLEEFFTCSSCGDSSILAFSSIFGTFGFCLNCSEIYKWKKEEKE